MLARQQPSRIDKICHFEGALRLSKPYAPSAALWCVFAPLFLVFNYFLNLIKRCCSWRMVNPQLWVWVLSHFPCWNVECVYLCKYACKYACMYASMCYTWQVRVCACVSVFVHMFVCFYVCAFVRRPVCMYAYICAYICIYTYMYSINYSSCPTPSIPTWPRPHVSMHLHPDCLIELDRDVSTNSSDLSFFLSFFLSSDSRPFEQPARQLYHVLCLDLSLFLCLSVCLSVYCSVYLSVCLSVYLSCTLSLSLARALSRARALSLFRSLLTSQTSASLPCFTNSNYEPCTCGLITTYIRVIIHQSWVTARDIFHICPQRAQKKKMCVTSWTNSVWAMSRETHTWALMGRFDNTCHAQLESVCCSVLQCVAVCCSVLRCVAVCCSVLQCVAVCCSVL